jgi:hypothetical protein
MNVARNKNKKLLLVMESMKVERKRTATDEEEGSEGEYDGAMEVGVEAR